MDIVILHNHDFAHLPPGIARCSQEAILGVVAAVESALRERGARVRVFPLGDEPVAFVPALRQEPPDLVINLCESLGGDSRGEMLVPGLLDLLGLPYTGSGPLTLALALHKDKAKLVLEGCGVPTPEHGLVERPGEWEELVHLLPAIVKPVREDASIGIDRLSVVRTPEELARVCQRVLERHQQPALVERYIEGRELNVGLFGAPPEVLPIAEIDFSQLAPDHPRIVTYAAKWDESAPEYRDTPPVRCALEPAVHERVVGVARAAFEALGLRHYGRVDMRLAADGTPYVIEVNPNCDLSPIAGFARAASFAGIDYPALVWRLVQLATQPRSEEQPAEGPGRPRARAQKS